MRRILKEHQLKKVGIIIGPGHHHNEILAAFKNARIPFRYSRHWPVLEVRDVDEAGNEFLIYKSKVFKIVEKLLYFLWRFFPHKTFYHRELLLALYDFLISSYFKDCNILIGWSQVSLFAFKKAKRNGCKLILEHPMVHALEWQKVISEEYSKFSAKIKSQKSIRSRWMLNRMQEEYFLTDQINVLSKYAFNTFTNFGIAEKKLKVKYLPSPYHKKNSNNKIKHRSDKFRILFVGRLELLKGFHYLIDAFEKLSISNAELWLVGKDYKEYTVPNNQSIKLWGEVSKDKLAEIYANADVLVFPSLLDAFGLVLLEALFFNLPIISTSTSGAPDIGLPDTYLKIIEPKSSIAIKLAIEQVYTRKQQVLTPIQLPFSSEQFSSEQYYKSIIKDVVS